MKRAVSFCLCLVMLLGSMSFAVSAVNVKHFDTVYSEDFTVAEFNPSVSAEAPAKKADTVTAVPFFAVGADSMFMHYSYLNDYQKEVYNAVLNAGIAENITVNFASPIKYTAPLDSEGYIDTPDEIAMQLSDIAVGGVAALIDDHPEIFWIYSVQYNYSSEGVMNSATGLCDASIKSIGITVKLKTKAYPDFNAVRDYSDRMTKAVEEFTVEGNTRYEKVKSIHDKIILQVEYDPNYNNANQVATGHEATSVFLEPFTTVCEGYAEAFKILCDRENIPCTVVVGDTPSGAHAWNYVKMDDGKWYAMDLTWDDPLGEAKDFIWYRYFLVGADTSTRNFETFESAHEPTGKKFNSFTYCLSYPELNRIEYPRVGANTSTVRVDQEKHLVYMGKSDMPDNVLVALAGTAVTTDANRTGAVITVSGNFSDQYYLIRWADVNAFAGSDNKDYVLIKAVAAGMMKSYNKGTPQFYASDLNQDGAIDGFDAIMADLYINGKIEIE